MQHEQFGILAGFAKLAVNIYLLPAGKDFRFLFRQTATHRELGAGQEDGFFIVHHTLSRVGRIAARQSGLPSGSLFDRWQQGTRSTRILGNL